MSYAAVNGMGADTIADMFESSAQTSATVMAVGLVAGFATLMWGLGAFGRNPKSPLPQVMVPNRRRRAR